jgi:hypothetical protein
MGFCLLGVAGPPPRTWGWIRPPQKAGLDWVRGRSYRACLHTPPFPFFSMPLFLPCSLLLPFSIFLFFLWVFIAFVGFPPLPTAFGGMFCSRSLSNSSSLFSGRLCCHQLSSVGIRMGLCWCLNCGSPKLDLVSSVYFSLPRAPPASSLVHHLSPAVLRDHVVLSHATAV